MHRTLAFYMQPDMPPAYLMETHAGRGLPSSVWVCVGSRTAQKRQLPQLDVAACAWETSLPAAIQRNLQTCYMGTPAFMGKHRESKGV